MFIKSKKTEFVGVQIGRTRFCKYMCDVTKDMYVYYGSGHPQKGSIEKTLFLKSIKELKALHKGKVTLMKGV